jgi:ATP-dependent protease HslVU (ClpYQ) peptidase subunit
MTVIVWDGKTLAADKQGTSNDVRVRLTKIRKIKTGEVLAACGDSPTCVTLMDWYEGGANPETYPKKDPDAFASLVVVNGKKILQFSQLPTPIVIEEDRYAWGSGREVALGALGMGADARKAVEVACQYCTCCGMGIDSFKVG